MKKIVSSENIKVWLYKSNSIRELLITNEEQKLANNLSRYKSDQFKFSRSCIRDALSKLFNVNPLYIPLNAPPGVIPLLDEGWGHISLSHCKDAVLIAWSNDLIGIDIERNDRDFKYEKIFKRFFNDYDIKDYKELKSKEKMSKILELWIKKEAIFKYNSAYENHNSNDFRIKNKKSKLWEENSKTENFFQIINFQFWIISIVSKSFKQNDKCIICIN